MSDVRGCKGCRDDYRVTDEQISRILQAPMFRSPEHSVSDDVYERRLAACGACDKLMNGTTCTVCGCIVQVAAKLKERSCPRPGGDRWLAIS
ncbi:DUF6171 family protein [Paenibacillus thailandensis]|uniref:DUF6171 family protein n=1 Tax=Paenibacillus thailandensis TaxID=393250 RepID=A0ABW5QVZ5_9BACL